MISPALFLGESLKILNLNVQNYRPNSSRNMVEGVGGELVTWDCTHSQYYEDLDQIPFDKVLLSITAALVTALNDTSV